MLLPPLSHMIRFTVLPGMGLKYSPYMNVNGSMGLEAVCQPCCDVPVCDRYRLEDAPPPAPGRYHRSSGKYAGIPQAESAELFYVCLQAL